MCNVFCMNVVWPAAPEQVPRKRWDYQFAIPLQFEEYWDNVFCQFPKFDSLQRRDRARQVVP
jgi:hypothetical protein